MSATPVLALGLGEQIQLLDLFLLYFIRVLPELSEADTARLCKSVLFR